MRLDTYVESIPAHRLYERYGFAALGLHTPTYPGTDPTQFHLYDRLVCNTRTVPRDNILANSGSRRIKRKR